MALNLSDIKTKRREIEAAQSRGNVWRPGKGNNRVRLAVWDSPVTGKTEFFREVWIHQAGKGSPAYVCGNSPSRDGTRSGKCPHCEQYDAIVAAEGKVKAQPFKVKKRYYFVCVPVEKMDQPFKARRAFQFAAAQVVGDAIIKTVSECDEVANVNDYFGTRGLDFKITFDPDAPPANMYGVKVMPQPKSEVLDPALFQQALALDPFADDACEPAWYLEAQGKEAKPQNDDEAPPPAAAPAAAVAPSAVTAAAPPSKFMTLDQAKAHIAQPGLEGWKAATDPDGDAYFIAPDGKTQYEAPVAAPPPAKKAPPVGNPATPEAQMVARGMKPSAPEAPVPPKDSDDPATDGE
jgi:hypothetical protein